MLQTSAYVPVGTTDHSELSTAFCPKIDVTVHYSANDSVEKAGTGN